MLQMPYRSRTVISEAKVQNSTLEVEMLHGDFWFNIFRDLLWMSECILTSCPPLLLQWFMWQHHSRHHLHLPGSAQPHLHPSGWRVPAGPAAFPRSQGNAGHVVFDLYLLWWLGSHCYRCLTWKTMQLSEGIVSVCGSGPLQASGCPQIYSLCLCGIS